MMTEAVPVVNAGYNGFGNGDGGWFLWVIVLFALFAGNGWGNRNDDCASAGMVSSEFTQRDIFNTNQNVSNTAATTQRDILNTGCETQRDVLRNRYELGENILENRYNNAINTQNIISSQKDCCLNS